MEINHNKTTRQTPTVYWWECSCGSEGKATRQQGRRSTGAGKHFQASVRRGDHEHHNIIFEETR